MPRDLARETPHRLRPVRGNDNSGYRAARRPFMTLPSPDPAFRWTTEAWGAALRCTPLEDVAQHLFTTRQLELRPSALDGRSTGERGWHLAAAAMHVEAHRIMRVKQVHGRQVRVLRRGDSTSADANVRPEADAQVSNDPDLVLAVQVADCVPLLMADPVRGVAAAVHAGWRGTAADVAGGTVDCMAREFGTDPSDVVAAIGPSIGLCCYQVGDELLDAFRTSHGEARTVSWFRRDAGRLLLDLWAANRDQLVARGLAADRIFTAGLCTQTNAAVLDSYRVDGSRAGRMAGLIRAPRPR
jgi:polyphenol oxidase